jgi:hypothetical protein
LFILVTFLERINLEISTLGTQTPHWLPNTSIIWLRWYVLEFGHM